MLQAQAGGLAARRAGARSRHAELNSHAALPSLCHTMASGAAAWAPPAHLHRVVIGLRIHMEGVRTVHAQHCGRRRHSGWLMEMSAWAVQLLAVALKPRNADRPSKAAAHGPGMQSRALNWPQYQMGVAPNESAAPGSRPQDASGCLTGRHSTGHAATGRSKCRDHSGEASHTPPTALAPAHLHGLGPPQPPAAPLQPPPGRPAQPQ